MPAMNPNLTERSRKEFIWPIAGISVGAIVGMIPSTGVTLQFGIVAWCVAVVSALVLPGSPGGARVGVLVAGLLMAVPCHVRATPLSRGMLMCFMGLPFAAAVASMLAPSKGSIRERLGYLATWCGTREVKRHACRFDAGALLRLTTATIVFAASFAAVNLAADRWLLLRWLAGGIAFFAAAEMVTACHDFVTALVGVTAQPLFRSPHRSVSVGEFWTRRWNIGASELFRRFCFAPLARYGVGWGVCAAFFVSGVAHVMLAYMAMGRLRISLICGAFFFVQPLLIAVERSMNVRRWRPVAGRAWTLAALAITSPLIVEPALQLIEKGHGAVTMHMLLPTMWVLGFAFGVSGAVSLASLVSGRGSVKICVAGQKL